MKSLFLTLLFLALGCFAFGQSDQNANTTSTTKAASTQSTDDTGNQSKSDVQHRLQQATESMQAQFDAADSGIPEYLLEHANCIIMIPNVKKAGFVFGGEYGRGFATCRTATNRDQWSAPAPVFLGGGSWGAQIGAESTDVLMLVMDTKGAQKLLDSKFKIGADVSGAAGPVGRKASADTGWKLNSEILTYSRSKGLFAGVDLSGASIKQDNDTTRQLYGKDVNFRQILSGQVRTPAPAREFIAQVHRDFAEARASK